MAAPAKSVLNTLAPKNVVVLVFGGYRIEINRPFN